MSTLPTLESAGPDFRAIFPSPLAKRTLRRGSLVQLVGLALLLAAPARALETVMEDNFALTSGSPVDPAKWTVSTPNIFKVNSGSSWSFFQGILGANASSAYAEVAGFSGKDVVVEFDLNRFTQASDFFDLVLRQNAGGNTRVRFKANSANTEISVAIMQPGSATTSTALGTTSFSLGQYDWASFRVRINDARVQVFAKETWNPEFSLLGEYAPVSPVYINAGAGTVRIAIPQSATTNVVNLDSFRVRRAVAGKQVFADFHIFRYTRESDGQLGNWGISAQSPQAPNHIANYNADLMDANGVHQLAAPGNPAVGMQSYNDEDYLEYHVLTAKMAGIDGFLYEYGGPSAGLTDSDLQKLQAVAQTYDFKIGINWLDALYYQVIAGDADYQAWCTANSKNPALDATKTEYIPQVFQKLITWVYDKPNAAKVGGKPLLPIFNGSVFTANDLATLKTKTYTYGGASNVPSPFLIPRRAPMGLASSSNPNVQKFWSDPWGWETQADGTFGWKPMTERAITSTVYGSQGDERDAREFARAHVEGLLKTKNDRVNIAGVMPGFDNQFNAAWGAWKVELLDRKNGLTYTQVWEQYLGDRDVIDAVLIPTWSDHTEGSGIEPMAPYGDREARATAKYSALFKGQTDTSASLDFTLPKELFELRKLAKFLESAGYPSSALSADRALLDSAAYDIAAGAYENAATKLSTTRTNLDTRRTNGIRETIHTLNFFTGSGVNVANSSDQYINIPDATADLVRSKNFDGVITFEYLDNSTFAANKKLYLLSYPAPANTGKPGENRSIQMQMRHGNGGGQWKTARVALTKNNLRLDHHVTPGALPIDLYFSSLGGASNGGTIRNVTVTLTTYATIPGTWDAGAATTNLLTPANWSGDAVPSSTSAAAAGRQDARWDGSVDGPLNLTFGGAFGGNWGVGLVMTSNQTNSLTLTNTNTSTQILRLINNTSGTVGGIQIASGAGALTIGAAGTAKPIQLVLGQGASALNYYFANNSANTATIEENVTILKGGSHAADLIFSTGNWNVKGVVSDLGAGTFNVNAGSATLSASNTFSAAVNVNGGTLSFSAPNNLGTGTNAVRLGQTTTSGMLEFIGSGNTTISRLMRVGNGAGGTDIGSGTIANNGTGVLTFSNATFNQVGTTDVGVNRSLTLSGTNAGNNTISGIIANNAPGLVSVIKSGVGKWILAGANTYSGNTTANAGILQLNQARLADSADVVLASSAILTLNFSDTDTIRSLYIDGSKQAPGTWGAAGSGAQHQTALLTGTGHLQVSNGATFSDWAADEGIAGQPADGDFDRDGIENLLEYALGLGPTIPSAPPGTFDGRTISFPKGPAASANGDVTYAIQTSTTLTVGGWTTVTPTVNSPTLISYTLPTGQPKIFARLLVAKIN
jgi:autotransporter-associated beta strand protein